MKSASSYCIFLVCGKDLQPRSAECSEFPAADLERSQIRGWFKQWQNGLLLLLVLWGIFAVGTPASASTVTWSGLDGTDNLHWSVAGNWTTLPNPPNDDLVFPTTTGNRTTNNDFPVNSQFNGITFSGASYTLAGNAINMAGNITSTATGSAGEIISLTLVLQQNMDISVSGTQRVDMTADIQGNFGVSKSGSTTSRWTFPKSYTGATTINNGTLDLTADAIPSGAGKGDVTINSPGILLMDNVAININGLNGDGTLNKTGSSSRVLTLGNNNAGGTFTGAISMTGGTNNQVTKVGNGTQSFGTIGTTTFNANGGTSLLNGTLTATNAITAASATIGGTGTATLSGAFTDNGNVAPGANAPGVFTVSAATGASFSATASLLAEIGGNTPGNYDQLDFTGAGAVTLNAATTLGLSLVNSFTPSPSDIYYIMSRADSGAFSTLFAGTTEGGTVNLGGGYTGQITYLANWTGTQAGSSLTGGNDVAIFNVVPEPASGLSMAFLGSLAFLGYRRRAVRG